MVEELLLKHDEGRSLFRLVLQAPVDDPLEQVAFTRRILAFGVALVGTFVAILEERLAPDQVVGAEAECVHLRSLPVLVACIHILSRFVIGSSAEVSEEKLVFAVVCQEEVLRDQSSVQDSLCVRLLQR